MTLLDAQGRPEPPLASDETETLVGFLEYQRATFAWKCSSLDAAGLKASVGASTMTLGGMLKHLAYYEDHWLSHRMRGNERQAVWNGDHWDADLDQLARHSLPDGRTPSVRWIVVHMIEEYARHNGHADLIRESVDGLVGE